MDIMITINVPKVHANYIGKQIICIEKITYGEGIIVRKETESIIAETFNNV